MKSIPITIKAWSAWMPGIHSDQEWQQWAQGDLQMSEEALPALSSFPAMLRRRLSHVGKMALTVASPLVEHTDTIPCVFCSRHGEMSRTLDLLKSLADKEPLSPMNFSLSVHNAIGGVMSIARKDHSSVTALASRDGDVSAALLEAIGIMDELGSEEILCVIYDEPVPEVYGQENLAPENPYAVAFLLTNTQPTSNHHPLQFEICSSQDNSEGSEDAKQVNSSAEPHALQLLKFLLLSETSDLLLACERNTWHWTKGEAIKDLNDC